MRLLKTLALAIVLALVPSTAAFAGPSTVAARYGTGTFTVGNVQLLEYGCFYHPYSANLNLGYETTEWDVDIRITAPNGSIFEFDYGYGYGGGVRTLTGEMFFCSSLDTPGTYTVTGVLETYEGTYDYTPTAQTMTPVQFQVLPYVAPTPPPPPVPPAPVITYADVTGSVNSKAITRGIKLTFKSKALPTGAVVGKRLSWKVLIDGKTRKSFTQGPSSIRSVQFTSPARSGRHKVKVLRNGKVSKTFYYRA